MAIVKLGIDLAKSAFAVHGVDATGEPPQEHQALQPVHGALHA